MLNKELTINSKENTPFTILILSVKANSDESPSSCDLMYSCPVLHTACIIERDKMNIYKLNVLFKKGGKKRPSHLRKGLEQRKKYIKTQPAHLNITAFVDVFVPNA